MRATKQLRFTKGQCNVTIEEYENCARSARTGTRFNYAPGDYLTKDEVDGLCRQNAWDVTVVPYKEGT